MWRKLILILCVALLFNSTNISANSKTVKPSEEFIEKYYFDTNLEEVKIAYFFREFPFYDNKGEITSLGKAFLTVLTSDVWTWVREPRIYVNEDIAYIHVVKMDGLNILYTLKRNGEDWKVVETETKKLPTVGSEVVLEKAFLRAIGKEILNATKTFYGEPKLFHSERIIDVASDIRNDEYDITIQIVTYERAIMPPYGFDTITLRLPSFEVIKYEHTDVSDVKKIPLETNQ